MPIDETAFSGVRVVSDCPEEVRALLSLCAGPLPRPFGVFEMVRHESGLLSTRPCVWGLDLTERRTLDEGTPGAVFVGPHRTYGNSSSAESTRDLFARIRDVRLVWL